MSFAHAPVTGSVVVSLVASSIAASLFDIKHYFSIIIDLHFWRSQQFWRALVFQLCYTNTSEMLFAVIALHQMRMVERMWGSRKFATFVVTTAALSAVITPAVMALVLRPMSRGFVNYLPAGPTAVVFAILAQYHAIVPHKYLCGLPAWPSSSSLPNAEEAQRSSVNTLYFSDKTIRYALALHLATLQWPGSMLSALVGWVLGCAWRSDLLPQALMQWRVPPWMTGRSHYRRAVKAEAIGRRYEEPTAAVASGTSTSISEEGGARRNRPGV